MHRNTLCTVLLLVLVCNSLGSRTPLELFDQFSEHHHNHHHNRLDHQYSSLHKFKPNFLHYKVLYQIGSSEQDLPLCGPHTVCNKVDLYEVPWLERQCRCPGKRHCPNSLVVDDGHTLLDKTRLYKLCEPIKKLPKCRYFRDPTWSLIVSPNNTTQQIVHCHCPKNAVTYLIKRQIFNNGNNQLAYQYSFACSPQSRLRCQRKEPCRLFTVRKRPEFLDEVNTNTLCQCPHAHRCPRHHTEHGVLAGKRYTKEQIQTYSGYCLPTT